MIYDMMKGTTTSFHHITMLLHKAVDMLDIKPDGVYVDVTLGRTRCNEYPPSRLRATGHLYAFDQDRTAINSTRIHSKDYIGKGQVTFVKDSSRNLTSNLASHGATEVDGILYGLGVSSPQLDERERDFSYKKDTSLDMRVNRDQDLSACSMINTYDHRNLARTFFKYDEDKFSKQTARRVEQTRKIKPIETTTELIEIIKSARPAKELKEERRFTKQIFQAIHTEVDDKLDTVGKSTQQAIELLAVDGCVSVITFHSLENRPAEQLFRGASTAGVPKGSPFIPGGMQPRLALVNRRPILPSEEESEVNNHSHLAKLRVAGKARK